METKTLPRPPTEEVPGPSSPGPRYALAAVVALLLAALALIVFIAGRGQQPPVASAPEAGVDDVAAPAVPGDPDLSADAPDTDAPSDPVAPAVTPVYRNEAPATWQVIGVRSGGVLNVRSAPGTDAPVVAAFDAGTTGIASTGHAALVGSATWREVQVPGKGTGWVHGRYLAEQQPAAAPPTIRQLAFLPAVRAERTPTVVVADYAEFYTGEEANRAAREDGVDVPPGGLENDYYIRNNNPRLRELEAAGDVRITILHDGVQERRVTVQEFAALLARPGEYREAPYWLTIVDGAITQIEQQYRP